MNAQGSNPSPTPKPLTADQVAGHLKNVLSEFTHGALLVAYTTEGEEFIISLCPNRMTMIALNALTVAALQNGVISASQDADE